MNRFRLSALSLLLLLTAFRAASAQGEASKEYTLKHKSDYAAADDARNPFWPIGFKPTAATPEAPQAPTAEAAPEVRPEMFVVTTISLENDSPLAVINGHTHGVGDRLSIDASGKAFVTVRKITDGAVFFEYRGQTIKSASTRRGAK